MMTKTIIFSLCYPSLFSLLLPSMINSFKKNVYSFLNFFTTATDTCQHHSISGLGLVTATTDVHRPPNVLESAMLKPNATSSPSTADKRVTGFFDDISVAVDGLISCTETLGFESSDEIHNKNNDDDEKEKNDDEVWRRRMNWAEGRGNRKKTRSFPPPLSSLNRNGKPSFYLRAVRKDGRLELTEVRIERSEILHASRHNGRLTLHLIPDQFTEEDEELEEEEEEEKEEESREVGGEWKLLPSVGGSEGLRRCHEMVNQHHHHVHGNIPMCGISIV